MFVLERRRTHPEKLKGHTVLVTVAHNVLESGSRLGSDYMFSLEVLACEERPSLINALGQILSLCTR